MEGAIIGGVIGGIAVFLLLLVGVYFYIKKTRESITQVKPYQSTPGIAVLPLETDINLVQRSRNAVHHQVPNYESNIMLTTMAVPDNQI